MLMKRLRISESFREKLRSKGKKCYVWPTFSDNSTKLQKISTT
jgi:hypothetical protein